jgi:tetratricopeptide (TPR) repeat protein
LKKIIPVRKYALVIGNSNYEGNDFTQLINPRNDALDMENVLESLGFKVEMLQDGYFDKMENAITSLQNKLMEGKETFGFLFYSGHGMQSKGENYLVPTGASSIYNETHLRTRAISVQAVLTSLQEVGNRLNIIVFDACRKLPSWARGSLGLATFRGDAPPGTIVMYATSTDSYAYGDPGRNSPFTRHLVNNLITPGISLFQVFDRTMYDVIRETNGEQHPELYIRFPGSNSIDLRDNIIMLDEEMPYSDPNASESVPASGPSASVLTPFNFPMSRKSNTDHFSRGEVFRKRGDLNTAFIEYSAAIKLNPYHTDAYIYRGVIYLKKGEYNRAITDFTQALRLDPNNANSHIYMGVVYFEKEEYGCAIDYFTQALRLDPNYVLAYYNRGVAYYNTDDYDHAIEDFTRIVEIVPTDTLAYQNRGDSYIEKKEYDSAIKDFTQVIKLDPHNVTAYQGRGKAYKYKGEIDLAIMDFTHAIELDPQNAFGYIERGKLYNEKKEYDAAIKDFTQAQNPEPDNINAHIGKGFAHFKKREYYHAIEAYTEAIKLDTNNPEAYHGRSLAYKELGDKSKAYADLAKAKELKKKQSLNNDHD